LAPVVEEPKKRRTPQLDWAGLLRRTFALDVFACVTCGGRRRVLSYLTAPGGVRAILGACRGIAQNRLLHTTCSGALRLHHS
jgi:hypothetical protein